MKIIAISVCLLISVHAVTQELKNTFDSLIDSQYKMTEPGGVVLVAKKGNILYERAFGMANMELGVPMKKDMVFCIASITKQFTAVAVLNLIEKGKLSLQDTVGKFLPEYPEAMKKITVEQLLAHTSGVPNAKDISSLRAVGRGWLSADQVMATFKDQPLDFTPGTAWAYSNSGYQLLGYIIEKVTGMPYAEYMDKNILEFAGMNHSFYGNDMKLVPNRASSYVYSRWGIENAVNGNVQIAFAAGAIQSTATDMLKWYQALLSNKFIRKETLMKAWSKSTLTNGKKTDYGQGWFIGELNGSRTVEHGGNMGGFMGHVIYMPDEEVLVVVLFNFRGKLPELLATDIAGITIGKPLSIKPIVVSPDNLQSYIGTYKNSIGTQYKITLEEDKLVVQKSNGGKWQLVPYGKDKFYFDNTSTIGEIQRDAKGKIIRFMMQTRTGLSWNIAEKIE